MATLRTGLLYTKTYMKKDGTPFKKFLFKLDGGKTYEVSLSRKFASQVDYENWQLPQSISVEDGVDYFINKESYFDKNGESKIKPIVKLLSVKSHEQAQFKSSTFDDFEK